jgi:ABC-type branched-subunit amino acid transport system ATPase component/ABC-type branched-subunit amino acid transport system permease subunit
LVTPAYTASLVLSPVVVIALVVFLRRGRLGLAMRVSAANPDTARMSGILTGRMSAVAWGISGAMAAFTVILVLPTQGFSGVEFLGPDLLLRALACAVIARMVSLPIALVSGICLGVLQQLLLANYPSGGQLDMVLFVVIILALLLQPAQHGRAEDKGSWAAVQGFSPLPRSYRKVWTIRSLGWAIAAAALIFAFVFPELGSNAHATTFSLIAVFAIIGLSLTLLTGLGGQLSLGQFAIAGVGAAMCYKLMNNGVPFVAATALAAATAAAVSLALGLPALRIKGLMLAVATLGFALAAEDWLFAQSWVFGTGVLSRTPAIGHFQFVNERRLYLIALATLIVALWLARNVWNGGVGRRLRAVRDNEDAARAFTIPATAVKLQTFVLGGVLAGLGGAIYGILLTQQSAGVYDVTFSINVAAVAVVGGLGVLVGPILGGLYIIGVPNWVPLDNAGLAATAAAWLFLLMQFPGGIGQALSRARDRLVDFLARRAGLDPATERAATPGGGLYAPSSGLVLPAPPERRVAAGGMILAGTGLTKRFGGLIAVNEVDIEVRAGETLGLIGPNGAGKTTLFEILGGFTRPDSGTIIFEGRNITRVPPERRAEMGLIRSFQDAAMFPTLTVREAVMVALERSHPTKFVPAVLGLGGRADRRKTAQAEDLLAVLGLFSFADTPILALSTGTRRITELACLIALEPALMLLDEPTSGIAQREAEALGEVLRDIKAQLDLTIVIIEHDIPLVMGLADRVVAMESGRVISVGTPAEVQSNAQVIASYLGGDLRAIERSDRITVATESPQLR